MAMSSAAARKRMTDREKRRREEREAREAQTKSVKKPARPRPGKQGRGASQTKTPVSASRTPANRRGKQGMGASAVSTPSAKRAKSTSGDGFFEQSQKMNKWNRYPGPREATVGPAKSPASGAGRGADLRKARSGAGERKPSTTTASPKKAATKKAAPKKLTFKQKFAAERKKQGPGGTFAWNGKKYTTDRADDAKKTTSKKDFFGKPRRYTPPKKRAGETSKDFMMRKRKDKRTWQRKNLAEGGTVRSQGYDARKDEQLGMTRGAERDKKMSMAGRRKVARATRKPRGSYGFQRS